MTIIENRVLKEVAVLPQQQAVNVQWANQIIKDDIVISETYERKAYTVEDKNDFMVEVESADKYLDIIGW